ncbi:MAG: ATP-binding protein [Sphingobacteriales bacterium]|nr:ATP-binding protein [Sphingobacteriales bacterium]MCC7222827.1 ATP-binding protein [Chitinophagales bacterium]
MTTKRPKSKATLKPEPKRSQEQENGVLEWKETIPTPQRIARTICGFANARGGKLIAGISDSGEIWGIIDPEAEKKRLSEAAQTYCEPPITLHFELQRDGNALLLITHIPEGKQKPYKALHPDGNWYAYIRAGAQTMRASRMVEKSLRNEPIPNPDDIDSYDTDKSNDLLDSKALGLLEHLRQHQRITTKQFQTLMNISQRRARRILVQLTLSGNIRQHDHNKEPYYTL